MPTLTKSANENFIACAILIPLTSLFVLVRLSIQLFYRRESLRGHDWFCLPALVAFNVHCGLIINFVSRFHALDISPSFGATEVSNLFKLVYQTELLFGLVITPIKLSILWLYHSIFSAKRKIQLAIQITAVICIIWFFAVTFVIAFQCTPVSALWKTLDSPRYCLSVTPLLFGYELSNLLIDIAILCIPVNTIFKLQLQLLKRIGIAFIFLLGAIVCILSVVRLVFICRLKDTLDSGSVLLWSELQLGLAIITCCLPILGPLPILLWERLKQFLGWTGSFIPFWSGKRSIKLNRSPWVKVGDNRLNSTARMWASSDNNGHSYGYPLSQMPSKHIVVEREIGVV
ncbi:hypothetical protein GGR55DRAFT_209847 [Xylaria sp. FL0064]|nr:hypothetical protein GGR55DRAFT_209847 [Xylaria sp. FL0064]